jgi:inner membrane protein involved in colicin E2 resistance
MVSRSNNFLVRVTHRDEVHIIDPLVPVALAVAYVLLLSLVVELAVELAAAAAASDENACENCAVPKTLWQ